MRPRRPHILIVDDEPDNLTSIRDLTAKSFPQVQVETAIDAEQALQAAIKTHPDVLVVDYQLPGTNGLDLLKLVRHAGLLPRRVLMTAHLDHTMMETAINDLHIEGYFAKPFNPKTLMENLKQQLERAQSDAGRIHPAK